MEIGKIDNINSVRQFDQSVDVGKVSQGESTSRESSEGKKDNKTNVKELDAAVDKANRLLFKNNTHLKFQIHEKTKEVLVKIIDDESGEVVKEIPPEKMLDMVAKLWEIAGIIVDEKR